MPFVPSSVRSLLPCNNRFTLLDFPPSFRPPVLRTSSLTSGSCSKEACGTENQSNHTWVKLYQPECPIINRPRWNHTRFPKLIPRAPCPSMFGSDVPAGPKTGTRQHLARHVGLLQTPPVLLCPWCEQHCEQRCEQLRQPSQPDVLDQGKRLSRNMGSVKTCKEVIIPN